MRIETTTTQTTLSFIYFSTIIIVIVTVVVLTICFYQIKPRRETLARSTLNQFRSMEFHFFSWEDNHIALRIIGYHHIFK